MGSLVDISFVNLWELAQLSIGKIIFERRIHKISVKFLLLVKFHTKGEQNCYYLM